MTIIMIKCDSKNHRKQINLVNNYLSAKFKVNHIYKENIFSLDTVVTRSLYFDNYTCKLWNCKSFKDSKSMVVGEESEGLDQMGRMLMLTRQSWKSVSKVVNSVGVVAGWDRVSVVLNVILALPTPLIFKCTLCLRDHS